MAFLKKLSPLVRSMRVVRQASTKMGYQNIKLETYLKYNPKVSDKLQNVNKNAANPDWETIRSVLKTTLHASDPRAVDSRVLEACEILDNLEAAEMYMNYIKNQNCNMSLGIIIKYFEILNRHYYELTESQKKDIQSMFKLIREKYTLFDAMTYKICIRALMCTDDWKMAIELFEECKKIIPNKNMGSFYSALINGLFRNKYVDRGLEYLKEMLNYGMHPIRSVYTTYVEAIQNSETCAMYLKQMFDIWIDHKIIPHIDIMDKYVEQCKISGLSANYTTISKSGHCECCNSQLNLHEISDQEFEQLKKSIREFLIPENIYQKSTPQELLRFQTFIQNAKPYDIVVDGLNIFYAHRRNSGVHNIVSLVNALHKLNKNTLILCRDHLRTLHGYNIMAEKAQIFTLQDLSQDDVYILNAAMEGGKNTGFISLDDMRQHLHAIKDPDVKNVFVKWLMTHQYRYKVKEQTTLCHPVQFNSFPQKQKQYYHISYIPEDARIPVVEFPDTWTCIEIP